MKFTRLGERGPEVSIMGFGAWAIGGHDWGKTDDTVSKKAIHTALDLGANFIDTADVYGFGHSEELIGEVIRERGKDKIIIASKAGNDFYNNGVGENGYPVIKENYKQEYLIFAVEKSLKRLGIDAIDIFQLHSPDTYLLEEDEPWDTAQKLKEQGKIKHIGWSIKSFKEIEQAFLLDRYFDILDCIQVRYNLLERDAEIELFPKAQKYGIGVIVRIPLLFGLLTGKFTRESRFENIDHRKDHLSPEILDKYLTAFENLVPKFAMYPDYTKAQVSLKFCISHPACHTVIPGAKTSQQVIENFGSLNLNRISF
jgi:aryl-alcohol dehydrogenase-like predicted oxidoreductase